MNIELANRLYEYRKNSGLSQEELAEKLGISRQSVSKWERAESCPDTDNLIELAKIYNVSLDALVNVDIVKEIHAEEEKIVNELPYTIKINNENNTFEDNEGNDIILSEDGIKIIFETPKDFITINYGKDESKIKDEDSKVIPYESLYTQVNNQEVRVVDIDGFGKKQKLPSDSVVKVKDLINGLLILVIAAVYISLCALKITDWGKFWVIFIYYPVITSLLESIVNRNANKFASPVFSAAIYLTIGMYYNQWHPWWIVFIFIFIYHPFVSMFKKKITVYFYDETKEKHYFRINDGDIKITYKNK